MLSGFLNAFPAYVLDAKAGAEYKDAVCFTELYKKASRSAF
jgi:hypothetical protein